MNLGFTPTRIMVAGSLAVLVVFTAIAGAITGAYVLTLHEVDVQQASQAALARRQAAVQRAAQLKQSEAVCMALVGLDDASHGAVFPGKSATGVPLADSYEYRLALAIHAVVDATDCRPLLAGKLPRS